MTDEKPCPKCGEPPTENHAFMSIGTGYRYECVPCGTYGEWHPSLDDAAVEWNRMTDHPGSSTTEPDDPRERWRLACEKTKTCIDDVSFEERSETAIAAAKNLLALAYELAGTPKVRPGNR